MPRRKKVDVVSVVTAPAAPKRCEVQKIGITSMICLAGELDAIYKGESPFACRCPLCWPSAWCSAVLADSAICFHPRAYTGDARLYPFCAKHYGLIVDIHPRPSEDFLQHLRDWRKAQAWRDGGVTAPMPLHGADYIYTAHLARVRAEGDPDISPVVRKNLSRILAITGVGGER